MKEINKTCLVKAEIPGVKKEDIKVSVDSSRVSLSVEVKKEREEKEDAQVIRSERYYGSLARSFSLAENVDSSAASAKYENAILKLTLPIKPNGANHLLKISYCLSLHSRRYDLWSHVLSLNVNWVCLGFVAFSWT